MSTKYKSIFDEAIVLEDLDIKESLLPAHIVSALRAAASLGYATLIVYDSSDRTFNFRSVLVDDNL